MERIINLFHGISFLVFSGFMEVMFFESVNQIIFADVQGEIITKTFFDVFVLMGGCGTSISLLISIFLFSKLKVHRSLGRLALLADAFQY